MHELQKYRTRIECITNFLRMRNKICHADLPLNKIFAMQELHFLYECDTFAQDTMLGSAMLSKSEQSSRSQSRALSSSVTTSSTQLQSRSQSRMLVSAAVHGAGGGSKHIVESSQEIEADDQHQHFESSTEEQSKTLLIEALAKGRDVPDEEYLKELNYLDAIHAFPRGEGELRSRNLSVSEVNSKTIGMDEGVRFGDDDEDEDDHLQINFGPPSSELQADHLAEQSLAAGEDGVFHLTEATGVKDHQRGGTTSKGEQHDLSDLVLQDYKQSLHAQSMLEDQPPTADNHRGSGISDVSLAFAYESKMDLMSSPNTSKNLKKKGGSASSAKKRNKSTSGRGKTTRGKNSSSGQQQLRARSPTATNTMHEQVTSPMHGLTKEQQKLVKPADPGQLKRVANYMRLLEDLFETTDHLDTSLSKTANSLLNLKKRTQYEHKAMSLLQNEIEKLQIDGGFDMNPKTVDPNAKSSKKLPKPAPMLDVLTRFENLKHKLRKSNLAVEMENNKDENKNIKSGGAKMNSNRTSSSSTQQNDRTFENYHSSSGGIIEHSKSLSSTIEDASGAAGYGFGKVKNKRGGSKSKNLRHTHSLDFEAKKLGRLSQSDIRYETTKSMLRNRPMSATEKLRETQRLFHAHESDMNKQENRANDLHGDPAVPVPASTSGRAASSSSDIFLEQSLAFGNFRDTRLGNRQLFIPKDVTEYYDELHADPPKPKEKPKRPWSGKDKRREKQAEMWKGEIK
ncbi:unnamed protein product, partial [Amoebophrya sp. A120]|eukprot:GSA120T00025572001.1